MMWCMFSCYEHVPVAREKLAMVLKASDRERSSVVVGACDGGVVVCHADRIVSFSEQSSPLQEVES